MLVDPGDIPPFTVPHAIRPCPHLCSASGSPEGMVPQDWPGRMSMSFLRVRMDRWYPTRWWRTCLRTTPCLGRLARETAELGEEDAHGRARKGGAGGQDSIRT